MSTRLRVDDVRLVWQSRDSELVGLVADLAGQDDEPPGTPPPRGSGDVREFPDRQMEGKVPEAEALLRRALAITLTTRGEGHPDTAQSYNHLATVLHGQGKLPEAEAMYRLALAVRLKMLGEGHPDTALSYQLLGLTIDRLGKAAEALDALTSAVDADEQARLRGARSLEAAAQSHSQ